MALITPWTGTRPGKNQSDIVFNAAVARFIAYITAIGPEIDQAVAELLVGANVYEWEINIAYDAPTIVAGSDGHRYACLGFFVQGVDPVGDTIGLWKQLTFDPSSFRLPISAAVPIENDIRGFNATVVGNRITFEPGGCMDSTGDIPLVTDENKTVTIPGTTNGDFYLFVVRIAADATVEFRQYTTIVGPESDAAIDAWRRISFAKNSAAGVTMPFIQVRDKIVFYTESMPVVTPTTTTSLVLYGLTSTVPIDILRLLKLVLGSSEQLYVSYDGINYLPGYNFINYGPVEILAVPGIYIKIGTSSAAVKVREITLVR